MTVRWGIMGTGGIAEVMVRTLHGHDGAEVVAVGSRDPDRSQRFAAAHGIPHGLGSYQAVAEHPEVEAVYVATTNDLHHRNVLDCAAAGTPVLCEKPLALSRRRVDEMVAAARRDGVFSMEAMWMRFLPFLSRLDELVAAGAVGEVRHVSAGFGFVPPSDPRGRLFNPALGGGTVLDLGIYPMTLALHVLGPPESTASRAVLRNGVDVQAAVVATHGNGTTSSFVSSFLVDDANEAIVAGSEGRIRVHGSFNAGRRLTVERGGEIVAEIDAGYSGTGFQFQVDEVHRCLREGRVESEVHPHRDSQQLATWMDEVRAQLGVVYPGE